MSKNELGLTIGAIADKAFSIILKKPVTEIPMADSGKFIIHKRWGDPIYLYEETTAEVNIYGSEDIIQSYNPMGRLSQRRKVRTLTQNPILGLRVFSQKEAESWYFDQEMIRKVEGDQIDL
jgi:hypothetical protein